MQATFAAAVLGSAVRGVQGDGYGHGIAKNTFTASDPITTFNFLAKHFPAQCQDLFTPCNESIQCGTAGRGALCVDANCSYAKGPPMNFGIHAVNTSARPFGQMDNRHVERHFTSKLRAAFKEQRYDAFMDFATVLFAVSLDEYIERLDDSHVPYLLLAWRDERRAEWYSLLVQVSSSQLVLELVSSQRPTKRDTLLRDPLRRLPAALLTGPATEGALPGVLKVLAVSKACSDLEAVRHFYNNALLASSNFSHSDGDVQLQTFSLHGADAHVRFVQRPANHTLGPFSVADLEQAKHDAHAMAMTSAFCGVDKWIDNHFAYDQSTFKLDVFKANFDAMKAKYHIFGNCTEQIGPGTNVYVVDPTGDSVQIDGDWDVCPEGGAGDALMNACGQGNCSAFLPSQQCHDQLTVLCGHVAAQNSLCSDCAYLQWTSLEEVGCSNADVVNYCVSSEEMRLRDALVV